MGKVISIIIGLVFTMWGVTIITGISLPIFQIGIGVLLVAVGIKIIIKK